MDEEVHEKQRGSVRGFRINEPDLEALERIMPDLCLAASLSGEHYTPRIRVQLKRAKEILSDVRWDYGPPQEVEAIDGN